MFQGKKSDEIFSKRVGAETQQNKNTISSISTFKEIGTFQALFETSFAIFKD